MPHGNQNLNEIITVVGSTLDDELDNTLMGISYTLESHSHGRNRSYPFLGAGVTLTSSASANTLGAMTEIIPVLANEVNTLTITHACDMEGTITIDLNGKKFNRLILEGDINSVASQLRAFTWMGDNEIPWTISGSDATVIFTRPGVSTTAVLSNLGATGITGTIVKTNTGAGCNSQFDIHVIQSGLANKKDTYTIVLYKGLAGYEDRIGNIRITTSSDNTSGGQIPIMTKILDAGTRISAQVAAGTGGSNTIVVSLNYHYY